MTQEPFAVGTPVRVKKHPTVDPKYDSWAGLEGIVVKSLNDYTQLYEVKVTKDSPTTGEGTRVGAIFRLGNLERIYTTRDAAVEHPDYYGGGNNPYEVIKVIEAWGLGFVLGNVVKYVARAGKKPGNSELQDLKKARDYINKRIEKLEENNGK